MIRALSFLLALVLFPALVLAQDGVPVPPFDPGNVGQVLVYAAQHHLWWLLLSGALSLVSWATLYYGPAAASALGWSQLVTALALNSVKRGLVFLLSLSAALLASLAGGGALTLPLLGAALKVAVGAIGGWEIVLKYLLPTVPAPPVLPSPPVAGP